MPPGVQQAHRVSCARRSVGKDAWKLDALVRATDDHAGPALFGKPALNGRAWGKEHPAGGVRKLIETGDGQVGVVVK